MKKERMICAVMLGLIVNWMIHSELWAVIYFCAVMTGLLVYYCKVKVEQVFESTLIRFVMFLGICLCFSKEIGALQAAAYLMMCVLSSAFTQRIQKADSDFLDRLSLVNMSLMPLMMIVLLVCLQGSQIALSIMTMLPVLFQPSGLPVAHPMDCFERKMQ